MALTLNTKTYTFMSDTQGVITWLETSGGVPTGFSSATATIRSPNKAGSPYRAEWRLDLPVVATADSACSCTGTVLRDEAVRVVVEIPDSGTTSERTDFALRLKDLVASSQFQTMLISLTRPTA